MCLPDCLFRWFFRVRVDRAPAALARHDLSGPASPLHSAVSIADYWVATSIQGSAFQAGPFKTCTVGLDWDKDWTVGGVGLTSGMYSVEQATTFVPSYMAFYHIYSAFTPRNYVILDPLNSAGLSCTDMTTGVNPSLPLRTTQQAALASPMTTLVTAVIDRDLAIAGATARPAPSSMPDLYNTSVAYPSLYVSELTSECCPRASGLARARTRALGVSALRVCHGPGREGFGVRPARADWLLAPLDSPRCALVWRPTC